MPGLYFILLGMFIGWIIQSIIESISIRIEKKQAEKRGKELEEFAKKRKEEEVKNLQKKNESDIEDKK